MPARFFEGFKMIGDILLPHASLKRSGAYFESGLERKTDAITANATYFGNAQWAQEYLDFCHRDAHFKSRWLAAAGDWTDKGGSSTWAAGRATSLPPSVESRGS
jgi:hypothetical protein